MYTIIFVGRLTLEPTHLQKGLPGLIQRHSCIQVASGTAIQPQSLQWGKKLQYPPQPIGKSGAVPGKK